MSSSPERKKIGPDSVMERARAVIEACRTADGFNASAGLYRELWLRDLVYSQGPLLKLGYAPTIRRHLETFLLYQRRTGQLPTVVSKGLRRLFNQRFHSWTADTELLFIIGAQEYATKSRDLDFLEEHREAIDRCLGFVRRRLNFRGLLPGADWRDAIPNLDNKFLLSNQILLVDVYEALGRREDSDRLKEIVRDVFCSPDAAYPVDCVCWEGAGGGSPKRELRLDSLGTSLSILNGTLSGPAASEAAETFNLALTHYGNKNLVPPVRINRKQAFVSAHALNSYVRNGAFFRNRPGHYQNSAVWPFIEARIVAALWKTGQVERARELSAMMIGREGFSEWYSPITGNPHGSKDQLWTAAAVLEQVLPRP